MQSKKAITESTNAISKLFLNLVQISHGKVITTNTCSIADFGAIIFCEKDYFYDTFKLVSLRHSNEFSRKSFSDSWINYV